MAKKKDLPAMPFYIGDWKKDPALQCLSREGKMIWLELIFLMWESSERGYLTLNSKPMPNQMIGYALNLDNQNCDKWITLFDDLGLFSRRENDGAIYSRKIVKIVELSEKRKNTGSLGGNPILVNQKKTKKNTKGKPIAENETLNENEVLIEINKKETSEIIYPFDSENFKTAWANWNLYRKEKKCSYKGVVSEQSALKGLSKFNEEFAIRLIEKSMSNGWQGLIFEKTEQEYEQFRKNNSTNFRTSIADLIGNRNYND